MRSTCTSLWPLTSGRARAAVPLPVYAGMCGALGTGAWAGPAAVDFAVAGRPTMPGLVRRLVVTVTLMVVAGVWADPILDRIRRDRLVWPIARQTRRSGATAVPADRSVRP